MATNEAVRRSHKIVELLATRYFDGLSNKELADILETNPVNSLRDMQTLEEIGYAKQLENGRWTLTARPLSIMQAYTIHYQNLQQRMQEGARNIYAVAAQLAEEGRI